MTIWLFLCQILNKHDQNFDGIFNHVLCSFKLHFHLPSCYQGNSIWSYIFVDKFWRQSYISISLNRIIDLKQGEVLLFYHDCLNWNQMTKQQICKFNTCCKYSIWQLLCVQKLSSVSMVYNFMNEFKATIQSIYDTNSVN